VPDIASVTTAGSTVNLGIPFTIKDRKALPKGLQASVRWDPIALAIAPVDPAVWPAFRHHHYLSTRLHPHAYRNCVGGFVDGECVAFCSWMPFMHPHVKNTMKGHRLVVLPDWQGLGLAGVIIDWLGRHLWDQGRRFRVSVAHPALIAYCRRSPRWEPISRSTSLQTGRGALTPWRSTELRILGMQTFVWRPPLEVESAGRVEPAEAGTTPMRNRRRQRTRATEQPVERPVD
jgi:GNAT superfamily N-acetyltransferase